MSKKVTFNASSVSKKLESMFPDSVFNAEKITDHGGSIVMQHGYWYKGKIFDATLIAFKVINAQVSSGPYKLGEAVKFLRSTIENGSITVEPTGRLHILHSNIFNSSFKSCHTDIINSTIESSIISYNNFSSSGRISLYDCTIKNSKLIDCNTYNSNFINCTLVKNSIENSSITNSKIKKSNINKSTIWRCEINDSELLRISSYNTKIKESDIKYMDSSNSTAVSSNIISSIWNEGACYTCNVYDITWMSGSWINSTWNMGHWLDGSWISGYILFFVSSDENLQYISADSLYNYRFSHLNKFARLLIKSKCDPEKLKNVLNMKNAKSIKAGNFMILLIGEKRKISNIIQNIKNIALQCK